MFINFEHQFARLLLFLLLFSSSEAQAGTSTVNLVNSSSGILSILIFCAAYGLVIAEEALHLRKSKPTILAAGIIWILVAIAYKQQDQVEVAAELLRHNLLEFAELMLFLISAMTYINTMEERNVFRALKAWLVSKGFSLKIIYWLTGLLAFFISPIADNLTTALIMGAVAMAVGGSNRNFIVVSCINIVIAANAGGAFSPFGDITTLMVWQKGVVPFEDFFALFIPALVNWWVPAACMSWVVPHSLPSPNQSIAPMKPGGLLVVCMFFMTIALTVELHHTLALPPFLGMMTGLGVLKLYGHFIRLRELKAWEATESTFANQALTLDENYKSAVKPFDIFISMKRVEWDTLLFFYGVLLCVGGLGAFGYLNLLSEAFYNDLGPTKANILMGILSALIDNIPIMFAILSMNPDMSLGQWLLVTLTAGVGGTLLSIGSAAGVALMGQARGIYTFWAHLKWSWAIALGYAASIWVHIIINKALF